MLSKDMKKVHRSKKTLSHANKTSTMYRLNKNAYQNFITTTYKKINKNIGLKITKESIKLAKQADILDKIEMNGTGISFIT